LPISRVAIADADEGLTDLARVWQGLADPRLPREAVAYAEREWALALARIEADLRDAEHGLAGTANRYRTQAAVLRRELDLKRIRLRSMIDVRAAERWRSSPEPAERWAPSPPRAASPQDQRIGRAASLMLIVLYVVVLSTLLLIATAPSSAVAAARLAVPDLRAVASATSTWFGANYGA
jgi:hypothetical protein